MEHSAATENKQDGQADELVMWLEQIGLTKYEPLLRSIGYQTLEQIGGLTPKEFKNSLKQAFANDIQFFSKVSAPDLGKFGSEVRKLNQQAEGLYSMQV